MSACLCKFRECVLCDATLFDGLSDEQFCRIRGVLRKLSYGPKERLYCQGDAATHLYMLRRGQVKLTTLLPDGREQIVRLCIAGQLLGFEAMDHECYPHTASTLTEVDACVVDREDMMRVVAGNPDVCARITRVLMEELEQSEGMIRELGMRKASERVAMFLLSLVQKDGDTSVNLPLHLARYEIAELLGLTTETVSRIMARFQREAIIVAPRGSVRILEPERLKSRAGGAAASWPGRYAAEENGNETCI